MLKKPYNKFYSVDNNNYYLLEVEDTQYLAVEGFLAYKGWFRTKEMQQSLKLLPLYTPIILALTKLAQAEQIDEKEVEGLGKETIYEKIDINDVRSKIREMTKDVHSESMFDFSKQVKSGITKRLMNENDLHLLMIQKLDSLQTVYWLAKSDQFGKLTIQECMTMGREQEKLMVMNTYVMDKELVGEILQALYKAEEESNKNHYKKEKMRLKKLTKELNKRKAKKEDK
jgi:hypothetical protein